jgi:ParB family chromosome partitioning protein
MVDLDRVERNPYQPRTDFDTESLEELKRSIQAKGVIQPITVRRVERGYQLISGERRVRAAREAGLKQIPAYILRVDSNEDMLELALIENLQREDLNPLEVAVGYRRLIEECNLTQEQVSEKVGKDRSTVANFLRLLKLPETIQVAVREGKISGGHARALAGLERQDIQLAIFRRVLEKGLSVRDTERLARAATTSGKNPRGGRSLPPGGSRDTALSNIEERLRQVLGTKVVVRSGEGGKGEIVIEFYSPDDLDRLLDMFAEIDNNVH